MLTFIEEDHSYWLDGRRLPGVTETIARFAPHWHVDEWYLQRGAAVHAGVDLYLQGELDPESVDPRITGRLNAAIKFLHESKLSTILHETRIASRRYQFAGTLDFLGADSEDHFILADWKGSLSPHVEPQMGAYALLLEETGRKCHRAVAVETHDDGTYKLRWFEKADLRRASQTFLAFLTVRNWIEANKIKTQP